MPISQGTQGKKKIKMDLYERLVLRVHICDLGQKVPGNGRNWKLRVRRTLKTHMSLQDSAGNQRWKSGHNPAQSLDMGKNSQTGPLLFQYTRALRRAGWLRRWAWKDSRDSDVSQWPRRNQRTLPHQRGVWKTAAKLKLRVAGTCSWHLLMAVLLYAVPLHPVLWLLIIKSSMEPPWGPRRQCKSKQYHF